jgi:hypothetical protein
MNEGAVVDMTGAGLEVTRVESVERLSAAQGLRSVSYRRALGLDPQLWHDEDSRDAAGYVLAAQDRDSGEMLVCGRALPVCSGLSELAAFGRLPTPFRRPDVCEISRVARSAAARRRDVLETLHRGALWLLENTELRHYVAYCRSQYLPLYRLAGAVRLDPRSFALPGRRGGRYHSLAGSLETAAEISEKFIDSSASEAA